MFLAVTWPLASKLLQEFLRTKVMLNHLPTNVDNMVSY